MFAQHCAHSVGVETLVSVERSFLWSSYHWSLSVLVVYRNLIRAILVWGSVFFTGVSRSVLCILDRAQHEAEKRITQVYMVLLWSS